MSRGMRTSIKAVVGTVVAVVAASVNLGAAPLPGFILSAEMTHVAVYTRPGKKADAAGVEKQVARLASDLGIADVARADYYHYDEAADLMAVTGTYAGGVTYPGRRQVHSTKESRDHELVHLVASQLGNRARSSKKAWPSSWATADASRAGRWTGSPSPGRDGLRSLP